MPCDKTQGIAVSEGDQSRPSILNRCEAVRLEQLARGQMTLRVMVMVKATCQSEAGNMPRTESHAAMGNFNEELVKADTLLGGEGLHPSCGKSMEVAVEWARSCLSPKEGDSEIEIRPLFEAADLGTERTPELRAQEKRLRAEVERGANRPR